MKRATVNTLLMLVLSAFLAAVPAFAQQEISPDFFDGSAARAAATKPAKRPAAKMVARRATKNHHHANGTMMAKAQPKPMPGR
jgi:hypothetical protein